jgi:hypothetical protein
VGMVGWVSLVVVLSFLYFDRQLLSRIFFSLALQPCGPRPTPMNFSVHFGFSRSYTFGRTPWARDQLVARPLPEHKHRKTHTHKLNIHALSGIRSHDPGFQASEDSTCLRPLGNRNRLLSRIGDYNFQQNCRLIVYSVC